MVSLVRLAISAGLLLLSLSFPFSGRSETSLTRPIASSGPDASVRGTEIDLPAEQLAVLMTGLRDAAAGLVTAERYEHTFSAIAVPMPFSHVGIRYSTDGEESSIEWAVRGSADGVVWTDWYAVPDDEDVPFGRDGRRNTQVFGLRLPGSFKLLNFIQLKVVTKVSSGKIPRILSVGIAVIDPASTVDKLQVPVENPTVSVDAAASTYKLYLPLVFKSYSSRDIQKPAVISRVDWRCPDGESSPDWPPDYRTVTHIIVHHTATSNYAVDWPAEVRAIWYYHARSLGWGDIGYNYLIDPNGYIYEGRAGGDDVVGGHALKYNWGSLGVALLGSYSTISPTAAALDSLTSLLAWKTWQRNIDPLSLSTFFIDKNLPTIMGHRDALPTACPGDSAYSLLPDIRQRVWSKLLSVASLPR